MSNLFLVLNFTQRFMRFNELTIFNPTIPTWDCVSLRVHRTSQKIPRKDLQKEMNEEFELITVTISLAATAMNQNSCRTATGKPAFTAVMQSMSRHVILPSAFGKEGRKKSTGDLFRVKFVKNGQWYHFFWGGEVRKSWERWASKKFNNKCSESSRSQIVFRTDIFQKLSLRALVFLQNTCFIKVYSQFGENEWRVFF